MSEPCMIHISVGEILGEPCKNCGHTNLAHPGRHNPILDECVLCDLLEKIDEGDEEIEDED